MEAAKSLVTGVSQALRMEPSCRMLRLKISALAIVVVFHE
jgi:hypothetical protein